MRGWSNDKTGEVSSGDSGTAGDRYFCTQGQELRLRVRRYSDSVLIYQAKGAACNVRPIKSRCTASSNGRQVFRPFYQSYIDKVKGYRELPAHKLRLRRPGRRAASVRRETASVIASRAARDAASPR